MPLAADEPSADLEPVGRIGKYELIRLLARGGMGEVHLARLPGELGFVKRLVIKTIRAELAADARFVELFAAEAKTAVALNHPNITPIYELGRADDGSLYTAMGWVDGPSLAQLLQVVGKVEVDAALFIVRELLDGLAYAHSPEHGRPPVVHRDITPRNVLVDRSGRVQLVDFGIAKPAARGEGAGPDAALAVGSPHYVAPEQARAEAVDPRADVFGAGCVLFELLTGARAFPRPGVWAAPALDELDALGAEDLRPALGRALAVDAGDRFPDASAFLRALAPALAAHAPAYSGQDLAAWLRARWQDGAAAPVADSDSGSASGSVTGATPQSLGETPKTLSLGTQSFALARAQVLAEPAPPPDAPPADAPPPSDRQRWFGLILAALRLALLALFVFSAASPFSLSRPEADERGEGSDPSQPRTTAENGEDGEDGEDANESSESDAPTPTQPPSLELALPPPALHLDLDPAETRVELDGAAPPELGLTLDGRAHELSLHHPERSSQSWALSFDSDAFAAQFGDAYDPQTHTLKVTLKALEAGSLTVLAPAVAWAEVWIDGAKVGTTPLTAKAVSAGRHRLEVRCTPAVCGEARRLSARTITIAPKRTKRIELTDR